MQTSKTHLADALSLIDDDALLLRDADVDADKLPLRL
jgi:hypothetical protein